MLADRLASNSWIPKVRIAEFVRFGVTGATCICLNVLIVAGSDYLAMDHLFSTAACFVGGTGVSFCLNRWWTFGRRDAGAKRDLVRYVIVAFIQLALFVVLCDLCVELLHIPYLLSIVALSFALAPLTFLLHRGFSFRLTRFS